MSQLQLEGVLAAAAKCDVSKKHEVDQLVAWTVQTYGGLDILVANAGIVKVQIFPVPKRRIHSLNITRNAMADDACSTNPSSSKGVWSCLDHIANFAMLNLLQAL